MAASKQSDPSRGLEAVFARMTWSVEDASFAIAGFAEAPTVEDVASVNRAPGQLVREADETTLLVRESELEGIVARHPRARVERDLAWIRFESAMDWEVVGFLARVTGALAGAGVPIGAVCGYSRDHLFVARRHLPAARAALAELCPERPRARA